MRHCELLLTQNNRIEYAIEEASTTVMFGRIITYINIAPFSVRFVPMVYSVLLFLPSSLLTRKHPLRIIEENNQSNRLTEANSRWSADS